MDETNANKIVAAEPSAKAEEGGDSGQIWAADKVEKMKSQLAIKAKEYKVELKRDEFGKIVGFEKVNIDISTPDSTETEG